MVASKEELQNATWLPDKQEIDLYVIDDGKTIK